MVPLLTHSYELVYLFLIFNNGALDFQLNTLRRYIIDIYIIYWILSHFCDCDTIVEPYEKKTDTCKNSQKINNERIGA